MKALLMNFYYDPTITMWGLFHLISVLICKQLRVTWDADEKDKREIRAALCFDEYNKDQVMYFDAVTFLCAIVNLRDIVWVNANEATHKERNRRRYR